MKKIHTPQGTDKKIEKKKENWDDFIKVALNKKDMLSAIIISLDHVSHILCMECLEGVPLKDYRFAHTNGHMCGARKITELIDNLKVEYKKRYIKSQIPPTKNMKSG